jgi:epoxyqueuosine reductase
MIASYARGKDYHRIMRRRIEQCLDAIALANRPEHWRILVDANPLDERFFAALTGRGFIGRNTMLILPEWGSRFFLGTVLSSWTETDIGPVGKGVTSEAPAVPLPGHGCPPACRLCAAACPTGALGERTDGLPDLDARRCLSWQSIESGGGMAPEFREANGQRVFGCEACLDACPFNKPAPGQGAINLESLLEMDNHQKFCASFAGTALVRAGWRQLLAMSCVAAGNSQDKSLLARLVDLSGHSDEVISSHAAWAVDRMQEK